MSNRTDLSKLLRGVVEDMDAWDGNRFQVPQMTQQQTPQVQIPMAPQQFIPLQETSQELAFQQNMDPSKLMPVDTAFNQQYTPESFDNIGVVPPVQMNIPQPTMPTAAPLPNSDNFVLRPPEQVVLGESAQGLPEPVVPESSGPYRLPDVPKYQVELNAPPTVRGEDQSQFDADVEGATRVVNTRALYDRAIQPLASGGLPTKGGMKSKAILGGGLFNRASGYFTDTPDQESQRKLTVEVRDYFDRDDVRKRIEADPKALALLERDPIGYYQSLTNDTVDEYTEEQPFTLEPNVPKPEGSNIPVVEPAVDLTPTQPAVTTTQPDVTGGSNLTQQDAEEAETTITDPVKTDADALVKGAGTAPKKDAPPEEKEGFLKKLWGGMKDMFKEGMEDPAFRKTLFAYVGSRALGYDGVTFLVKY